MNKELIFVWVDLNKRDKNNATAEGLRQVASVFKFPFQVHTRESVNDILDWESDSSEKVFVVRWEFDTQEMLETIQWLRAKFNTAVIIALWTWIKAPHPKLQWTGAIIFEEWTEWQAMSKYLLDQLTWTSD